MKDNTLQKLKYQLELIKDEIAKKRREIRDLEVEGHELQGKLSDEKRRVEDD